MLVLAGYLVRTRLYWGLSLPVDMPSLGVTAGLLPLLLLLLLLLLLPLMPLLPPTAVRFNHACTAGVKANFTDTLRRHHLHL
jgi:hypothetical protein